jgi:hypothetical protein
MQLFLRELKAEDSLSQRGQAKFYIILVYFLQLLTTSKLNSVYTSENINQHYARCWDTRKVEEG